MFIEIKPNGRQWEVHRWVKHSSWWQGLPVPLCRLCTAQSCQRGKSRSWNLVHIQQSKSCSRRMCPELVPLSKGRCESLRIWLRASFAGEKNSLRSQRCDEEKALRAQREAWHEAVESEQGPGTPRERSAKQAEQEGVESRAEARKLRSPCFSVCTIFHCRHALSPSGTPNQSWSAPQAGGTRPPKCSKAWSVTMLIRSRLAPHPGAMGHRGAGAGRVAALLSSVYFHIWVALVKNRARKRTGLGFAPTSLLTLEAFFPFWS